MIFKPWMPWAILAAIIVIGAWTWYINDSAYNRGYAAKQYEYEKALFEAKQKIDYQQAQIARGYDIASKEIREAPDGGCVGPAVGISSEWLRNNYSGQ